MEVVVERKNMLAALQRVRSNKGAAGIDQMTVDQLGPYLKEHWLRIKAELLAGTYQPAPVRSVAIPKPDGKGERMLGIPTVVDRLIQQALHQVISPIFDPNFSDSSYGFRPGRSAHDAVLSARDHVASGKRWVVDIDLEKYFDRVNHDILMSLVARKITDRRALKLIRRYLQAGAMLLGVVSQRSEGTPQGGPLSPVLSNIMLDENGRAMLTDFGLAKGPAYTVLTKPGQVMGTLDYLAPELIRGEAATPASDIYALGCVVYESLSGSPPFGGKSLLEVGSAHLAEPPPDPRGTHPELSSGFVWAMLKALEKDPAARPPTATAYASMLHVAAK